MNMVKNSSLNIVIPSALLIIFICLQTSLSFFEYKHKQQILYNQKIQFIKTIAVRLQTTLPDALTYLKESQIQNLISEITLFDSLQSMAIIDAKQQIIVSNKLHWKGLLASSQLINYNEIFAQQSIHQNTVSAQHSQSNQAVLIYAPINVHTKSNSLNSGSNSLIFINYSLKNSLTDLKQEILYGFSKSLFTFLIMLFLLSLIIKRFISDPIRQISQSLQSVNKNSIGKLGISEIGILQHILFKNSETVTESKKELSENEQRLMDALSAAKDGVWDWDIQEDVVYYSERCKQMLGFKGQKINNDILEWESRVHQDDLYLVSKKLQQHFSHNKEFFESTHRVQTQNGDYIWVLSRGKTVSWDEFGLPLRIVGTTTDVTHYKKAQEKLSYQAKFDTITQLPNRRQLLVNLEQESIRATQNKLFGAIIFIECNQYKTVSNLQEYYKAESLLYAIARRIEELKSGANFTAHLSGSEFVTILPDLHHERESAAEIALEFAKNLDKNLKNVFEIDNKEISLSCAFGIEMFPIIDCDAEDLLRQSTMAVKYSANEHFSNISFFAKEIEQKIHSRHVLQRKIHFALENNEFSLYFQPRISADGLVVGAEALIRWQHGSQGWVSPAEFIPEAENSGLILPLGDWVIKEAFEQLAKWQHLGLPDTFTTLSINVSPKQLLQTQFSNTVEHYLKKTQVDAKLIEIEITEDVLLTHKQLVIDKLNELRTLGLCFAIDDFGTGYSSFSYLSILPVSTLKIDQSFIATLMQNKNQQLIVTSIINLALSLKLEVVAEGIEFEDQLSFLIDKGCTQFQGYLIGTPMAKQEFQSLLFKNIRLI